MRDLHPDFARLIQEHEIAPVRLVELHTEPEPVYVWDGLGPFYYAGKTFLGLGHLGEVDPIRETANAQAAQLNLTLHCLDLIDTFADLRNIQFRGRAGMIHYALLSTEGQEVLAIEEGAFIGRMDSLRVKTGPRGARIILTLTNEMAFLKKAWGRFQTDSDHQADFPGDTSRRFIPAIQDLNVRL